MAKLLVGTSGFAYSHWENGVFYPKDLPKNKKLEYYCTQFQTVELNNTFYRLPREKVFESWQRRTPKDFVFAIKVSRFITHVKKLRNCQKPWLIFLKRALKLKEKLGPFLFQLPPFFKKDVKKLKNFTQMVFENSPKNLKFAFEFRHESWCDKDVYKILEENNIAWVVADSPHWPKRYQVTANFVYVRMHGSKTLFSSNYSKEELRELAKWIKKWKSQNLDIFVYFNNDAHGFAPKNAKELVNLI